MIYKVDEDPVPFHGVFVFFPESVKVPSIGDVTIL